MKPNRNAFLAASFMLACSAAMSTCLDFTPIRVASGDAAQEDAMGDAFDDIANTVDANEDSAECRSCLGMPACRDKYAACLATPKCEVMFECGADHDCYNPGGDLVGCLTICGQQAGLASSTDPAVAPFLALYQCATTQCASSCAVL